MKTQSYIATILLLLVLNCASTSGVIYDYNLDVDFNQYDTYVLCVEDFAVENANNPKIDNAETRKLIADAVANEMEEKAYRTNVFEPQLQAGFRILIEEETVTFENCEHYKELEYWESCKIHEETYEQETLIVYVADFKTNEVLWHASILCDLNKSKRRLKSYIAILVKELFDTYPKTQVGRQPDDTKNL